MLTQDVFLQFRQNALDSLQKISKELDDANFRYIFLYLMCILYGYIYKDM